MKKVFIPSYGGGHANIMKLLYPLLKRSFDVEILALTLADDIYNNAGIPHNTIKDYLHIFSEVEQEKITEYGKKLAEVEYNPNSAMQYDDCIVYLGIGMMDLVSSLDSLELAEKEFHDKGRKAFCPVKAAKTILQHIKPDIVVLSVNVRFEAAAGIAANELGIPVLYINDLPVVYTIPFKANLAVMNEYTKKIYIESAQKTINQIYVTGQPIFDRLFKDKNDEVSAISDLFRLDKFEKVIVYLEQNACEESSLIEKLLFYKSKFNKDILFIMKLHPNSDISSEIESVSKNFLRTRDIALIPLLKNADLAITRNSTSGLEAALLGVPLLLIGWEGFWPDLDYSKFDIGIKVTDIKEFNNTIDKMIVDTDLLHFIHQKQLDFYNKTDAVKNVVQLIKKLLLQ